KRTGVRQLGSTPDIAALLNYSGKGTLIGFLELGRAYIPRQRDAPAPALAKIDSYLPMPITPQLNERRSFARHRYPPSFHHGHWRHRPADDQRRHQVRERPMRGADR